MVTVHDIRLKAFYLGVQLEIRSPGRARHWRRRFHYQQHATEPWPVKGTRKHGQDRPVRRAETRPVDLSLQHQDLVAKSEDLSVTPVTGHQ